MIEYRKADINDIDDLARIRIDFLSEACDVCTKEEKKILFESNRTYFYKALLEDSFASWLAIHNGKIIATSGITFYTLPPNHKCPDGKVAYISNMFTYPEFRQKGIATNLFSLIVEEAGKRDCSKILLNATDMGRPIYQDYGFKDLENEMVYYIR